jgi:hypothetical protein
LTHMADAAIWASILIGHFYGTGNPVLKPMDSFFRSNDRE